MGGFAVLKDKQDKSEMIEENNEIQNQETLGNKLQKARKDLNLSVKDVAEKLRLKSVVIENFENDIFTLPDLPATFTKGYLRSYVRLLKLPDELFEDTVCSGKKKPNIKPMKIKPQTKPCRSLLKIITILVLLMAFGMTLLWWWQNYQQEQQKRETLVTNSDNVSLQATDIIDQQEVILESNKEVILPNTAENENSTVEYTLDTVNTEQDETNTDITGDVETKAEEPQRIGLKNEDISDNSQSIEKKTNVLLQNQFDKSVSSQIELESKAEQPVAIKDDLRIEIISAPSWITVRGDNRKTLASKIYKAGEVLTFNDNSGYRLTIGAPVNVKIYYKGNVVPLKLDGRVARIKLP